MRVRARVELYKEKFSSSEAVPLVKSFIETGIPTDYVEYLERIRELNTELTELYRVVIPTITVGVRDDSYVTQTGEIYLTEPSLGGFLHQFRHHLQQEARRQQRQGILVEGKAELAGLPYRETVHAMYGEDDARAWAKYLVELAEEELED